MKGAILEFLSNTTSTILNPCWVCSSPNIKSINKPSQDDFSMSKGKYNPVFAAYKSGISRHDCPRLSLIEASSTISPQVQSFYHVINAHSSHHHVDLAKSASEVNFLIYMAGFAISILKMHSSCRLSQQMSLSRPLNLDPLHIVP